jgi:hypothetical protein
LFGGRQPSLSLLAGAAIWLIASFMPEVAESVALQALLSSMIIAAYMWLAAGELWRISDGQLVSRLPAFFMLFAQGAMFLMRTPLGVLMPHISGTERLFGSIWLTVLRPSVRTTESIDAGPCADVTRGGEIPSAARQQYARWDDRQARDSAALGACWLEA